MTAYRGIGSCIPWEKATVKGYGVTWREGRKVYAHRAAYCDHNGVSLESIKGKLVRHRCDNPSCVRGSHLRLGTAADNSRDMVKRGRSCARERNPGAKLTEEQVEYIRENYIRGDREWGQTALARRFSVSPRNIGYIVRGEHW